MNAPSIEHSRPVNRQARAGATWPYVLTALELPSIRLNKERLGQMRGIDCIVVVGASASGKTTIVNAVREAITDGHMLGGHVVVPRRVVTRPTRQNDDEAENIFVTAQQFAAMDSQGLIGLRWTRTMEEGRTEEYGFLRHLPHRMPVYSANNGLLYNADSIRPMGVLDRALIILVYCPDRIRRKRLEMRSPDLIADRPAEATFRLEDRSARLYWTSHVVVKNFGQYEVSSTSDVVALLRTVIGLNGGS